MQSRLGTSGSGFLPAVVGYGGDPLVQILTPFAHGPSITFASQHALLANADKLPETK